MLSQCVLSVVREKMKSESLYADGYSFTLGVVGVAHGAKVGRLPVPRQAAETCRQCVQQTSAHGGEVDRSRVICAYLGPPDVAASTSPQP